MSLGWVLGFADFDTVLLDKNESLNDFSMFFTPQNHIFVENFLMIKIWVIENPFVNFSSHSMANFSANGGGGVSQFVTFNIIICSKDTANVYWNFLGLACSCQC